MNEIAYYPLLKNKVILVTCKVEVIGESIQSSGISAQNYVVDGGIV